MVSFMSKDMNYSLANANEDYNNLVLNPYNYSMNFLYPFNLMYPPSQGKNKQPKKVMDNFFYSTPPIDKNEKVKLVLPESNKNELLEWYVYIDIYL